MSAEKILRDALLRIAEGNVMPGNHTHIETVHEYQRIARDALEKTSVAGPGRPNKCSHGRGFNCPTCWPDGGAT